MGKWVNQWVNQWQKISWPIDCSSISHWFTHLMQFVAIFFLTCSQIGIELACRKPMNMYDKNRTTNEIYLLDSNWNIKNKMFRRLSYVLLSWLLESVSLVRKAATAEYLPGKRSWMKKACIVTFMSKKSLFLYFWFGLVCVPWDYISN